MTNDLINLRREILLGGIDCALQEVEDAEREYDDFIAALGVPVTFRGDGVDITLAVGDALETWMVDSQGEPRRRRAVVIDLYPSAVCGVIGQFMVAGGHTQSMYLSEFAPSGYVVNNAAFHLAVCEGD